MKAGFRAMLFATLLHLPALSLSQAAEYYWSFNDDDLAPDIGSAGMSVALDGFGILWTSFGTGTTVNAVTGYDPGSSLSDVDIATAFNTMEITMFGLDLTGLSNIGISFATRSTAVFSIGEFMQVDYDIGSGFTGAQIVPLPDGTWSARQVNFGSVLNPDLSNVSIRITLSGFVDVLEFAEFDNIQIVPEPASWLLAAFGAGLLALAGRRRRASKIPPHLAAGGIF